MHTLCLLGEKLLVNNLNSAIVNPFFVDIKVKEQTVENMMKKKPIYEPPRFMTNQQAAEQLMEIIKSKENTSNDSLSLLLVYFMKKYFCHRVNWRNFVRWCCSSRLAGSED